MGTTTKKKGRKRKAPKPKRPGPKPGTGGRPPKAADRVDRTIRLDKTEWKKLRACSGLSDSASWADCIREILNDYEG